MSVSTGRAGRLPARRVAATAGVIVLVGVGGVATGAFGDTALPALYPDAERHAPSPLPDRIILTPTADMTTSQSVTWRTDEAVETAVAEISPMSPGPKFEGGATRIVAASSEPIQADLGFPVVFHTATFEGLQPSTPYLYRVGDGTNWSAWLEFETASTEPEPFSFIYYGDAQNSVHEHVSRVFRRAFSERPQADLILHAGDLVDVSTRDNEWGEWFDAAGWINGGVNNIAIPGNHEYRSGQLAPYWDEQFEFPRNGPAALQDKAPESAYFVDHQGVRFIGLNSNLNNDADMQLQAEFLDQALEENPGQWSVVTFHHPVFATTGTRNNQRVRDFWNPIIEKHNVDLVLQGHDHSYARGHLVNDLKGQSGVHDGTVYVVSVSGQKMYALNDGANWTNNGSEQASNGENVQLYQLIDVDGDQIRYEARTADGVFYDGFVIDRSGGTKKVMSVDENGQAVTDGRRFAPGQNPAGTPAEHGHDDEPHGHTH